MNGYTEFLVLFLNAEGELQSAWNLADVSIGRAAVRAYAAKQAGDVVVIDYPAVAS